MILTNLEKLCFCCFRNVFLSKKKKKINPLLTCMSSNNPAVLHRGMGGIHFVADHLWKQEHKQ